MIAKVFLIYGLAAAGELAGTYVFWKVLKENTTAAILPLGLASLAIYACINTWQPEGSYGRTYAAYAGIFLIGAMLWGWLIDGTRPDNFDILGASISLVGILVVLWGRDIFA